MSQDAARSPSSGNGPARIFRGGGGDIGELVRAYDWASSPIGAPEAWSCSLKTIVDVVIGSPLAMVILWGPTLTQIYNAAYAEICAGKHPAALGQATNECWPEVWAFNGPIYEAVRRGEGRKFKDQPLEILRSGRLETAWFDLTYSAIGDDDGEVGGVLVTVAETTEQIQRVAEAEARAQESMRLLSLFDLSPGFIAALAGPDHRFEFVNEAYTELVGQRPLIGRSARDALPEVEGQGFFEMLDEVFTIGVAKTRLASAITVNDATGRLRTTYVDFVYQPMIDRAGQVTGILVAGHDASARVSADEHQMLLRDELNHRVKNIFATVQALVRLTSTVDTTADAFRDVLTNRIHAMAMTQDLLVHGAFAPVAVEALLRNELEPYLGAQVSLRCDDLQIPGERAVDLGLLVHELLTNAAKHGGLATPDGRVSVDCAGDGARATLVWTETRRDLPLSTGRRGFGTKMLGRLAQSLGGDARFDMRREGLSAVITFDAEARLDLAT